MLLTLFLVCLLNLTSLDVVNVHIQFQFPLTVFCHSYFLYLIHGNFTDACEKIKNYGLNQTIKILLPYTLTHEQRSNETENTDVLCYQTVVLNLVNSTHG